MIHSLNIPGAKNVTSAEQRMRSNMWIEIYSLSDLSKCILLHNPYCETVKRTGLDRVGNRFDRPSEKIKIENDPEFQTERYTEK